MRSRPSRAAGIYDVDAVIALVVQLEALSTKVDGVCTTQQKTHVMQCDFCGGGHGTYECQVDAQAAYLGSTPSPLQITLTVIDIIQIRGIIQIFLRVIKDNQDKAFHLDISCSSHLKRRNRA